jgi:hypothetical protein
MFDPKVNAFSEFVRPRSGAQSGPNPGQFVASDRGLFAPWQSENAYWDAAQQPRYFPGQMTLPTMADITAQDAQAGAKRRQAANNLLNYIAPNTVAASKQLVDEYNKNMTELQPARAAGASARNVGNVVVGMGTDVLSRPVGAVSNFFGGLFDTTPESSSARAANAPRGNGIVPNADVSGTYTPPAQKPAARPISVVRALQNTDYLPTMNDQGQVQYVSREVLADRASKQQAAAKADVDIKKTMSETEKNLRYNKAIEARLAPLPTLEATLNSPNSTEEQKTEAQKEIDNIFADTLKLEFMSRYRIPGQED